ncbi:MAG: YdiU family protein [Saprospiraceae bacterium]
MLKLQHTFTDILPADPSSENVPRQVLGAGYSYVEPKGMIAPSMIIYSQEMVEELSLDPAYCLSDEFCQIMAGNKLAEGSTPYAMCYGGHQFGNWAGQLGDGRAINLGECVTTLGSHQNLQLKGAGPTPYSRTADGLAVLRSSIREFLCSEAMYHLGVPTTRALALVLTGEEVWRDMMYDGNPSYEKGAVVCRVAPSFVRFGNFEILAARKDESLLKKTADYVLENYYPHLLNDENPYLALFKEVADKTCQMIVDWQRVGFVHGVMNTDNMSILGLTIDYGPYGWIDDYDPNWTPNTTDLPGKRYRFGNQPVITQWNLLKLANALYSIINDESALRDVIEQFRWQYNRMYQEMMKQKLGLYTTDDGDETLISDLEKLLVIHETDMTIFFRELAHVTSYSETDDCFEIIKPAFYIEDISKEYRIAFDTWFEKYLNRLKSERISQAERKVRMNGINPKDVLRNYMAQLAIDQADKGDYTILNEMYEMLKQPYEEQIEFLQWYSKRPDWARKKIGCSMLSCSS